MSIVRLVVAWLIMAALPLQGFAAASMLFCGHAPHGMAAQAVTPVSPAHDHAGHDHAGHVHAAEGPMMAHADAGPSGAGNHVDSSAKAPADGHACPICASCCNLVALPETPQFSLGVDAPAAQPLEQPVRMATRASPAPDKPPRA